MTTLCPVLRSFYFFLDNSLFTLYIEHIFIEFIFNNFRERLHFKSYYYTAFSPEINAILKGKSHAHTRKTKRTTQTIDLG